MRKVKSAMASSNAAAASPLPTPERKRKKQLGSDSAKQQIRSHSSEGNRPPRAPPQHPHPQQQHQQKQQQQQHHQEVIDSNFPPSAPHHSPVSPRGGVGSGGYHIRISSQGSVSSLGSNVAGADDAHAASAGGESSKLHYADSREHWYYMQKQKTKQEQLWQQHQRNHPGQQQQHPNYNVNYNAILGREVAQFLHGEHVAKAAERNQQSHQQHHRLERQNQQRHSHNPYGPPAPPHGWNPHHHNASPQWGQPQEQQQHGWYTGSHEHLNQHIRVFTPPTTWDAHSNNVAHHHLYQRQVYSPSGSEDEGDDASEPLMSKNKYAAAIEDERGRKSGSQQQRPFPPSTLLRQSDLGQFPSNQRPRYYHSEHQGGNVHRNDRSTSDKARRPHRQQFAAHVEESLLSEKSSLLHGSGKYIEYRIDHNLGGRDGQHHVMPPQNIIHNEGAAPGSSTKKKTSKRRRHYKVRK